MNKRTNFKKRAIVRWAHQTPRTVVGQNVVMTSEAAPGRAFVLPTGSASRLRTLLRAEYSAKVIVVRDNSIAEVSAFWY